MVAHAPSSYYQHAATEKRHYPIAHANPLYFQPGYIHPDSLNFTGRKGRRGRGRGHKKAAAKHHATTLHGSPLVSFRDPWGNRAMGRTRGH